MPTEMGSAGQSMGMVWTGRVISGLVVALMLFGVVYGFVKPEESRAGFQQMGYPVSLATPVTIAMLVSVLLYAIPRTCVFGAILLSGYMGGAVATHLRLGQPQYVVPFVVAALAWLGIWLREARLRAVLPLRAPR